MSVNPKLSAIAARIRALQALATNAGATEHEALAAAGKARELLDKYQLDMGEFAVREEGTCIVEVPQDKNWQATDRLAVAIARHCSCRVWHSSATRMIKFLGLRSDAEFAGWLASSLSGFVSAAALDYSLESASRIDVRSFVIGAIQRINERLRGDATLRISSQSGGTALVVLKNQLVNQAFADLGLNLSRSRGFDNSGLHGNAYSAGRVAGDSAGFGRPIQTSGLRIGHSKGN